MERYKLRKEIKGYVTNEEATSEKAEPHMIAGSQNVLIDPRFGKFGNRGGYSRLGAANMALTAVRQAPVWNNSTGGELPLRMYDDELEVYLSDVGGQTIDAWTRVKSSLDTTAIPRFATWWDGTEDIDVLLFVINDDNIYEWGGGVFTVKTVDDATHITKKGDNTWAEDRIYTSANKTLVCVRTGTEYTYSAGESGTQLTVTSSTGLTAGDILMQKIVTNTDKPATNRDNNYIMMFENQIFVGSDTDNEVLISANDDYTDYSYSSPRVAGEGGILTLDGPTKGFGVLSRIPIIFSGNSGIFTAQFEEIAVSTTLAETLKVRKLKTGVNQGAFNQETIVPIGDSLIYLTNESALRMLQTVETADQPQLKALSNPIKPDFDNETWTNACAIWHRNRYYLSSSVNSKIYILDYVETADGRIKRFWQPPQILPVRCWSVIDSVLYGHSNVVPETYLLFTGASDGVYSGIPTEDKLPIQAIAKLAYRTFGDRANLKNFDEFYVEGNISPSTDNLKLTLRYDFGGATQEVEKIINGTDNDIIYESLEATSLGQQPLGSNPLGGANEEAPELARFRVVFGMPKEDFHEIQETYETNEADKSWEIIATGPNVKTSARRDIIIKK